MPVVEPRPVWSGLLALCLAGLMGWFLPFASNAAAQSPSPSTASSGAISLPADIPVKRDVASGGEGQGAGVQMLGVGFALVVIVASVYAANRRARGAGTSRSRWWARLRSLAQAAPSAIECSASMRLTPRHSLHVVEWEGRRLLVGCGEQSICLVAEVPPEGRA